jgi:hypothetical protein
MLAFWSGSFIRVHTPDLPGDLSTAVVLVLGTPHIAHARALFLGCLFLVGLYRIWRAVLGQYPIATRLVLFSVPHPLLDICLSYFAHCGSLFSTRFSTLAFTALSFVVVVPSGAQAVTEARNFRQREATRDMVITINAAHDLMPVYLVFGRYSQWGYYAGDWNHAEVWKPRIDAAYTCLISTQLGYLQGPHEPARSCLNVTYPAVDERPQEILGNLHRVPERASKPMTAGPPMKPFESRECRPSPSGCSYPSIASTSSQASPNNAGFLKSSSRNCRPTVAA